VGRHFSRKDDERRFKFDSMDTLPYWYEPLLRTFAQLGGERLLQEIEHWIIDSWGYSGDIRELAKERRRRRLESSDFTLIDHRHGSRPTLERLNTHLEWHGMWCAVGELLKTERLALCSEDDWMIDDWDDLGARIRRNKLSEPPLWSADLLIPVPLIARNWRSDARPLEEWVLAVAESDHRAGLFPDDQPEYVVVDGRTERLIGDRVEMIGITSALVEPLTGGSLLRALQTMHDAWDYKLPDEGEYHEINQGPYRLLGWLRKADRDNGLDDHDPLRGYASIIVARPGQRVIEACQLHRDSSGHARWFGGSQNPPMFIYEVWGERPRNEERYTTEMTLSGRRLLAHRGQLQGFLCKESLDLIVGVEVMRRERQNRRYPGEEEKESREEQFDRLYRLQSRGAIEIAEGCLGSWTGDRSTA
jgi:hypothetical protein